MICKICNSCDCYACQEPHDKERHREYEELHNRLSKKVFPEMHNQAFVTPTTSPDKEQKETA